MCKWLEYTEPIGECLVWTRCLNTDGYPRALVNGNANGKVHREVFHHFNGYYPPVVRHTCDNPKCINPEHLSAGDPTSNMADRRNRGRTHGHVSEEEIENVLNLRSKEYTYKNIGETLGIKYKRVEYIINKYQQ